MFVPIENEPPSSQNRTREIAAFKNEQKKTGVILFSFVIYLQVVNNRNVLAIESLPWQCVRFEFKRVDSPLGVTSIINFHFTTNSWKLLQMEMKWEFYKE